MNASRTCSICGGRKSLRDGYVYCIECDPELTPDHVRGDGVIDIEPIVAELLAEENA